MDKVMKRKLIAATLLAASTAFAGSAAQAAKCAERSFVVGQLEDRFGESLMATSDIRDNAVLEVFSSEKTESWTVMISLPARGLTCMVASGSGFSELRASLPEQRLALQ